MSIVIEGFFYEHSIFVDLLEYYRLRFYAFINCATPTDNDYSTKITIRHITIKHVDFHFKVLKF